MRFFRSNRGEGELVVLFAVIVLFSIIIAGGLFPKKFTPPPSQNSTQINAGSCCANNECDPRTTGKKFSFKPPSQSKPIEYGLLRSEVTLREYNAHMLDSGEKTPVDLYNNGNIYPIVTSTADGFGGIYNECGGGTDDQVWGNDNPITACTAIPNDSLLYVCKDKCYPEDRSFYRLCRDFPPSIVPCFGQQDAVYDIYYSIPQYNTDGSVPPVIKQCSTTSSSQIIKQVIITQPPDPKPDLQLKKIDVQNVVLQTGSAGWISPYCKPAIYLYPTEKTNVRVAIAPQGKLTMTLPQYPQDGWQVTAYPNGNISYQNNLYDYLYYEAQIPDNLIEKPKEAFVIAQNELSNLFADILPKLGLNEKEATQFSEYWFKALPKSPYYFVGIVSTNNLNSIAPLSINPQPDHTIRVTLYFEMLETPLSVPAPTIHPVNRAGFTAVEWGGIVKTDPAHPFSCFM